MLKSSKIINPKPLILKKNEFKILFWRFRFLVISKTPPFYFSKLARLLYSKMNVKNLGSAKIHYDFFRFSQNELAQAPRFDMTEFSLNFNKNIIKNILLNNNNFWKKTVFFFQMFNKFILTSQQPLTFSAVLNNVQIDKTSTAGNLLNSETKFSLSAFRRPFYFLPITPINAIYEFLWNSNLVKTLLVLSFNTQKYINYIVKNFFNLFYFYSETSKFNLSNLNYHNSFSLILKKKIIKTFNYRKFNIVTTPWQTNTFIRFMEFCSGSKIAIRFFFFLNSILSEADKIRCVLWEQRLRGFQRNIGSGFFLFESIEIIYISLKIKDPFFLINWMAKTLHRISFWKHRAFFHYLRYAFKYFFWEIFEEFQIKGIRFKLKGKISVSGNARTRKINYYIGKTGASTYENKILQSFDLIKTFTGVMGLQIWMVF